jgi:hypothetical protein
MRSRRLLTALAAVVLALSLQACGDQEKSYCSALSSDQKTFAEMQEDSTGVGLLTRRTMLHSLADKAPDDLTDEWQTFLGALDAFATTLHDVGVKPTEFVDGQPPARLSAADRARVAQGASELSDADVVEAANGIEQQAKDVCKLQLGL